MDGLEMALYLAEERTGVESTAKLSSRKSGTGKGKGKGGRGKVPKRGADSKRCPARVGRKAETFKQADAPAPWHPMMKPFAILTDGSLTTDPAVIEAARAANMIAAEARSLPSLLTGGPMYQAAEVDGRLAIVPRNTVPGARDFPPFPGCHGIYETGPLYRF